MKNLFVKTIGRLELLMLCKQAVNSARKESVRSGTSIVDFTIYPMDDYYITIDELTFTTSIDISKGMPSAVALAKAIRATAKRQGVPFPRDYKMSVNAMRF